LLRIDEFQDGQGIIRRPLVEMEQLDAFLAFITPVCKMHLAPRPTRKSERKKRAYCNCTGECQGHERAASAPKRLTALEAFGNNPLFECKTLNIVRQYLGVSASPPLHRPVATFGGMWVNKLNDQLVTF
jgi:hypothetical protein